MKFKLRVSTLIKGFAAIYILLGAIMSIICIYIISTRNYSLYAKSKSILSLYNINAGTVILVLMQFIRIMFVAIAIYGFGILVCAAENYLEDKKVKKSINDIKENNGYTPKRNPKINYGDEV